MAISKGACAAVLLILCASAAQSQEAAGPTIIPFPYVFYSPETSLAGGVIMLVTWPVPTPSAELENVIRFGGYAALAGQAQAFLSSENYLDENRMRITLDSYVGKLPNKFFGVGPSANAEEAYVPFDVSIDTTVGFLLAHGLYLGPRLRLFGSWMQERASGGALVQNAIAGSNGTSIAAPGVRLTYEGRDSSIAPSRGCFLDFSSGYSFVTYGDGSPFPSFTLDARAYTTPFTGSKVVLAGQFYGALVAGNVPFQELPRLGGDELLRGYYDGRFRDKTLAALQAEIRIPVWWRFGVAVFGGVGFVAPSVSSFRLDEAKLSGGAGLRFVLDEKSGACIRADLAWAGDGVDFYFNLGEAF